MKKSYLLFVFSFSILFTVSAQGYQEKSDDSEKRKNFFLGAGLKGDVYLNDGDLKGGEAFKNPSLGGNVFVGKWVNKFLGARVLAELGQAKPYFQQNKNLKETENYFIGRLDVLLDVTNLFRSYSPDQFYNLIPYVGIGYAQAFNAKDRPDKKDGCSSIVYAAGLMNTFRLSDKFSAQFSLGIDLVDSGFDGSKGGKYDLNGIAAAAVGIVMNF